MRIDDSSATLAIESVQTGERRELQPTLSYFRAPRWSPDGRLFIGYGADIDGRTGIVHIDATSGAASLAAPETTCSGFPFWAVDSRSFYCFNFGDKQILQVDLASGAVLRRFDSMAQAAGVSPDGKYLVAGAGNELAFTLIPTTDTGSRRWVKFLPEAVDPATCAGRWSVQFQRQVRCGIRTGKGLCSLALLAPSAGCGTSASTGAELENRARGGERRGMAV